MTSRLLKATVWAVLLIGVTVALIFDRTGEPAANRPSVVDATLLGVVEGVTEFLPISSTGHLLVANRVLGIGQDQQTKDAADTFTVVIQIGAIVAVLWLYRARFETIVGGVVSGNADGRRLAALLAVSFAPAAVLALALGDWIKEVLFAPGPVAAAWVVGGAAMVGFVRSRRGGGGVRPLMDMRQRDAIAIGLAQCIALWPGVSRSLVTIVAALLCGLSLAAAVEYSFLLGAVTLTAAGAFELATNGSTLVDAFGWGPIAVGLVTAFIAAVASIRWLLDHLRVSTFAKLGWYRVMIGAGVGLVLLTGAW